MSKVFIIIFLYINLLAAADFQLPRIDLLPNSELTSNVSLYKNNYSYNFNWVNYSTSEMQSYQVTGNYWLANFRTEQSQDDILQFYKKYRQKKNGELLHSDNNNLYFKIAYPAGFITWIHVNAFDRNYKLNILEQIDEKYAAKAAVDSSKLKKDPDAVIYYDENRCSIEKRFQKELERILGRLDKDRSLILEIRGYSSEDEGEDEDENMQLAKKRVLMVKKELFNNGIPSNRVFDTAYGIPAEKNRDSEKDQRVELYLKPYKHK